jgi:hypothetical protein
LIVNLLHLTCVDNVHIDAPEQAVKRIGLLEQFLGFFILTDGELLRSYDDGKRKGNRLKPAVVITPAMERLLLTSAALTAFARKATIARIAPR